MGSNARVAIYAPSTLAPYVSLPSTIGGSTGYYSGTIISGTSTWVSTAIAGCKAEIYETRKTHVDFGCFPPCRHSVIIHSTNNLPRRANLCCTD